MTVRTLCSSPANVKRELNCRCDRYHDRFRAKGLWCAPNEPLVDGRGMDESEDSGTLGWR